MHEFDYTAWSDQAYFEYLEELNMTDTAPVTQALPQTEPAGVARFQAASAMTQAQNAIKSQLAMEIPAASKPQPSVETPAVNILGDLTKDAADSVNALEARITELERVVHRLALGADGVHPGIQKWLAKVGARIKALL